MSHQTTLKTELKSEHFIRLALQQLGIPVLDKKTVHIYDNGRNVPADIVVGDPHGVYHLGIRLGTNGEGCSFVGDWWGIRHTPVGNEVLTKLGGEPWRLADYGEHTGAQPVKLLQTYGLTIAAAFAMSEGQDVTQTILPDGDIQLTMRGGSLPGSAYILFTAAADGSTRVAVFEMPGEGCKELTKRLEDALGQVATWEQTPDWYHTTTACGIVQHVTR